MGALLSAGGRGQRPRTRGGDAGPLTGEAAPRPRSFEQLSRITVTLVRAPRPQLPPSLETLPFAPNSHACVSFPVQETPAQCADLAASVPVARQHDILALRPTSERALAQCCTTLDVDVISLDLSQRLPVRRAPMPRSPVERRCVMRTAQETPAPQHRLRPQLVKAAVQRGVVFEICYAPLIGDVSSRRQLLSNAISLVRACGALARVRSSMSARHCFLVHMVFVNTRFIIHGAPPRWHSACKQWGVIW